MPYDEQKEMQVMLQYHMSMQTHGEKPCPECSMPMPVEKWAEKCALCVCREIEAAAE